MDTVAVVDVTTAVEDVEDVAAVAATTTTTTTMRLVRGTRKSPSLDVFGGINDKIWVCGRNYPSHVFLNLLTADDRQYIAELRAERKKRKLAAISIHEGGLHPRGWRGRNKGTRSRRKKVLEPACAATDGVMSVASKRPEGKITGRVASIKSSGHLDVYTGRVDFRLACGYMF